MQRSKIKQKTEEVAEVVQPAAVKSAEVKWVNNGGAFYTKSGARVDPGATFFAKPDDVPQAFRDVIKPVDPGAVEIEEKPKKSVPIDFRMKRRGGTQFYDIVDGDGKRINEKDLAEQEAKTVLSMLVG